MSRLCLFALVLAGCADWTEGTDGLTEADHALIASMVLPKTAPFDPTNNVSVGSPAAIALGKALFFDASISSPPGVSCASCHDASHFFIDSRTPDNVSLGVVNLDTGAVQYTKRNAPSLLDVAFYKWWGWDGRSDSLWMQCGVAYESPSTMNGKDHVRLAEILFNEYWGDFLSAFPADFLPIPGPDLTPDVAQKVAVDAYKAMAAYVAQLTSANSRFDRFANGEAEALNDSARRGLKLFLGKAGCIACHNGPAFNGEATARGPEDFFKTVGVAQSGDHVAPTDFGRFDGITNLMASPYRSSNALFNDSFLNSPGAGLDLDADLERASDDDKGRFRIKSLRNVASTGPYMHAGQIASLNEVVHFYNSGGDGTGYSGTRDRQLGPINLTAAEEDDVVSFLESLTGDPPTCPLDPSGSCAP